MTTDLGTLFRKYEALVKHLDGVFEGVRKKHPECVTCDLGCSDCCHALFDLYMIEAIYINQRFMERVVAERKDEILVEANRIDRQIYQLKRRAFKALEVGEKTNEQVLIEMASARIRCPLLNSEGRCEIYAYRPITCRLYGIPTAIDGRGHSCGLSGFKEGNAYPTVNLDSIHQRLHGLSCEVVGALKSRHQKMGDVLMPLSMALLTHFDEAYLGVEKSPIDPESGSE